jgi:hypothetical protein
MQRHSAFYETMRAVIQLNVYWLALAEKICDRNCFSNLSACDIYINRALTLWVSAHEFLYGGYEGYTTLPSLQTIRTSASS